MRRLIFFESRTCPPCRYIRKTWLEKIEDLLADTNQIETIVCDDNYSVCKQYEIQQTPTIVLMEDDVEKERYIGSRHPSVMGVANWLEGSDKDDCD